jgi:hypothetical protein
MVFLNQSKHMHRFAVLIPVGPHVDEQNRVCDLLDSVLRYQPNVAGVVLVDDGGNRTAIDDAVPPWCKVFRVTNPRCGRGNPIAGGLCVGMLSGLARCLEVFSTSIDFILKVDTDALVIAPFAKKLVGMFESRPDVGMTGAYLKTPNGDDRDFSPWTELATDLAHRWIPARRRWMRAGRWGPFAASGGSMRRRAIFREAFARGYVAGHHCLGGAYAITQSTVQAIADAGYLRDPMLWLDTSIGEDVLISCLTQAVGKRLVDCCGDQEVFGIRHRGLADAPDSLVDRGFSIIHSVKTDPRFPEKLLREYFRQRRRLARAQERGQSSCCGSVDSWR